MALAAVVLPMPISPPPRCARRAPKLIREPYADVDRRERLSSAADPLPSRGPSAVPCEPEEARPDTASSECGSGMGARTPTSTTRTSASICSASTLIAAPPARKFATICGRDLARVGRDAMCGHAVIAREDDDGAATEGRCGDALTPASVTARSSSRPRLPRGFVEPVEPACGLDGHISIEQTVHRAAAEIGQCDRPPAGRRSRTDGPRPVATLELDDRRRSDSLRCPCPTDRLMEHGADEGPMADEHDVVGSERDVAPERCRSRAEPGRRCRLRASRSLCPRWRSRRATPGSRVSSSIQSRPSRSPKSTSRSRPSMAAADPDRRRATRSAVSKRASQRRADELGAARDPRRQRRGELLGLGQSLLVEREVGRATPALARPVGRGMAHEPDAPAHGLSLSGRPATRR